MGLGRIDKLIHSHGPSINGAHLVLGRVTARTLGVSHHLTLFCTHSGPFCVGTATGELGLTSTHLTPGLGVNHHLTPYSILCDSSRGWHPNGLFVPGLAGLPRESPEVPPSGTPGTLKAHNFRSRPPIELPSEGKL